MKRTTKRYIVTTSALNCYGYRVLTEGVDLTQYLKNPQLFWMHKTDTSPGPYDKTIPLGRAVDIKKEGDEITCALEFSESNPFAMVVYGMYEDNTLNMLSLGAKPLVWSEEPEHMLEGQTGYTFTKSKAFEISCVDIGANDDALGIQLYDADDKPIQLSGLDKEGFIKLFNALQPQQPQQQTTNEDTDNMKLTQLNGAALNGIMLALKLEDTATEIQVQKAVADMIQLNATQASDILTLKQSEKDLKDKVTKLEGDQKEAAVIKLVDDNAKKFLPGQRDKYIRLAKVDLDGTKELLEGMPDLKSVTDQLQEAKGGDSKEVAELIKLSYDELWKSGQLEKLQKLDNEAYLTKRAEKFPVKTDKK